MNYSQTIEPKIELKPARCLILRRGKSAAEYWTFCEEVGCDVYDELAVLDGTLGEPMGLWLPTSLRAPGTSEYVMGVEVPRGHAGPIPSGMERISLPPQAYLVFHGPPYEESQMGAAISAVVEAADAFDPSSVGCAWCEGPRYQLAPNGERGYIEGRPVIQR